MNWHVWVSDNGTLISWSAPMSTSGRSIEVDSDALMERNRCRILFFRHHAVTAAVEVFTSIIVDLFPP